MRRLVLTLNYTHVPSHTSPNFRRRLSRRNENEDVVSGRMSMVIKLSPASSMHSSTKLRLDARGRTHDQAVEYESRPASATSWSTSPHLQSVRERRKACLRLDNGVNSLQQNCPQVTSSVPNSLGPVSSTSTTASADSLQTSSKHGDSALLLFATNRTSGPVARQNCPERGKCKQ